MGSSHMQQLLPFVRDRMATGKQSPPQRGSFDTYLREEGLQCYVFSQYSQDFIIEENQTAIIIISSKKMCVESHTT